MSEIIQVNNLSKKYRTYDRREGLVGSFKDLFHRDYRWISAVDSISFSVKEGELLGYIGPNGAGKSTSIKMLTGILKPSSGDVSVWNYHPFYDRKQYTKHIGVVFGQRTQLWWDIAVRESFNLLAKIYEVDREDFKLRLARLSEILDLERLLPIPVRKLSLGERMRCDLAASLLHQPKVLFLDEPTIGLDAVAKDSIRNFLRQINKEFGTTIILTTHDLKEIEELCKRIIVLDKGSIIYDGDLSQIKAMSGLQRTAMVDFLAEPESLMLESMKNFGVVIEQESFRRLKLRYDPQVIPTAKLVGDLFESGSVADLAILEPSIEEVIMKMYREGVCSTQLEEARITKEAK